MTTASLVWLAIIGIAVAAAPLIYVWRSRDAHKFRKLAWITAFLTLDLIMVGSFTRLTDSGLGCPDWPGCYGKSNPWSAANQISQAQAALPTGPVDREQGVDRDGASILCASGRSVDHRADGSGVAASRTNCAGHFAVVGERSAGLGLRARPVWRIDGDDETAARHRDAAPVGRNRPAGDPDLDRAARRRPR